MANEWLRFLRHYGPIARNDNMYDETIQRSAKRAGVLPIEFNHPYYDYLIKATKEPASALCSIILTGTAGDGKTHLCRQVWNELGGEQSSWDHDDPYLLLKIDDRKIHFIRDLSAWAPQQGQEWAGDKAKLLQRMCQGFFEDIGKESFIIAANDGQLVESWRRLPASDIVERSRAAIEDLLVEDRQELPYVRLKLFNLSRTCSTLLYDRALDAFMGHSGWEELLCTTHGENEVFGTKCPIRHNFELLHSPLVNKRLRSLLELCNHNGLHVPIRQILLLLANTILGHPDAKDFLLMPSDIPKIITAGTVSKASLFNNVFGGNLPELRRETITIFDYFGRFQIGYETSNRIDNLLIFGENDQLLGGYFEKLIAQDEFYGADHHFYASKREYIEGISEDDTKSQEFMKMLISQRRGLFFKIPLEEENELNLWELTVFKYAGEYLEEVVAILKNQKAVKRPIVSRLVKGLNRIFTGMFINSERELYLATSGNYSQAKVSRILLDRLSVEPSKGEKIILRYDMNSDGVVLSVYFKEDLSVDFNLTLIRYEYLSRIAQEGSLPSSFSKECYEDVLAFKSQLIASCMERQALEHGTETGTIALSILSLTEHGMPDPKHVEIVL
jgi:hypothetical protein